MTRQRIVLLSPFLIIVINLLTACFFGCVIGKWAFVPMILIGWGLWSFFILRFGGINSIKKWLTRPEASLGWGLLALLIGLIPLPIFILHSASLKEWEVWFPWIVLALINPWIEEFYWRGLLSDYTKHWPIWVSILFGSTLFAVNHIAFGINSEVNRGVELIISTFIMGLVWALLHHTTKSLRWAIFSHFLVDFFNLSAPAFLDLFEKGNW
ncbi:CPBP family intramembrane metalloprotease [Flagellimonas sp. HMM57]|uniref:CPBP family intramembrane glutamic endopeptidase n=1 Tax=unclassified Flagellimonas TaxID=2644544 RepID=UPI0013D2ADBE|nr:MULTISPECIES: CPBP family intramembrane glutamic endopeptidase [unclassified Flagellimonas]UII77327.1 CPBP family intramembrane metalloprotease [Flagellimonas sp. HMM57]